MLSIIRFNGTSLNNFVLPMLFYYL